MARRSPIADLGASPLDLEQARLLETACPMPTMVANVEVGGFSVLAIDSMLRRFVVGARHPAGPVPGEIIGPEGFGPLGPSMHAATVPGAEQQVMELPIGDEPIWFELTITPVVVDGECRQIVLVAADRTADHDIEQRHRRSARRFQAMVTHAPGLILLVDSTGRIIRCSPAVERLLGMTVADLVGRPIFELLHPDTLARAASVFNQILSQPGDAVTIDDFRMNHATGGQLWCEATATNLLHDDDVAAIVFNAYDVTDRRIAEKRLELLASRDPLTGLANRRRLEQRLDEAFEAAARVDGTVALALVDVDDFKLVNDGLGHDVGDAVIRGLGNRFGRLVGDDGFVARVGGDEFALVLSHLENPRDLGRLSDAVHETLRSPMSIGDHDVYIRASVGTTTGHPVTADAGSLLRSADLALYRAKRNGRNQTVAFTAELQLEAEKRLETITALQRAIREDRLRLAYQQVVDGAGVTVGAEALLRWEHDGELLSPATFLQLAEDTGLILPMGAWVLEQACRDLNALRESVPGLAWISVNMSSRQLLDERLPLTLRRTMQEHGIAPGSIAIEIDEDALRQGENATEVLEKLTDVKVMLSLADLAGEQAALYRIEGLPIDTIKLDRKFVQQLDFDPDGHFKSLGLAVLQLAEQLGIAVVAEGVETRAQADVLRALGVELFQGFHFGEPLNLGSFITRAQKSPE